MELLSDRSPMSWLRERDIDLLMCSELHSPGALQSAFGRLCAAAGAEFRGAWVSHSDTDGESDLIVSFQVGRQTTVLLVENKITATFQPNQALRYTDRALRWQEQYNVLTKTVLICPEAYLARGTAELFDVRYSYEKIVETLDGVQDPRSKFLARCLNDGIVAYRRGYQMVPDAEVTSVWAVIWNIAQRETPDLRMTRPAEKPGRSTWVYFYDPLGFDAAVRGKCVIAYKAERGQVDLQFSSMRPETLASLVHDLPLPADTEIVKAEKSASLRSFVPKVEFTKPAGPQEGAISVGLRQAEVFRKFFVDSGLAERFSRHQVTHEQG